MIAGLVPAAGKSRRMGFAKLLLEVEGKSLLAAAIEKTAAVTESVLVVVGAYAEVYAPAAQAAGGQVVMNPDWQEGLASSLRTGISALAEDMEAVLIVLPDQPFVHTGHLAALIRVFQKGDDSLVLSRYNGILGAPGVVGRELFPNVLELSGKSGAKALVSQVPSVGNVVLARPFDIDTIEQAQRFLAGEKDSLTPD